MNKKLFIAAAALLLQFTATFAQKSIYIPNEWRNAGTDTLLYAETDTENKYTWSKSRSKETDNFILFWDKYYGNTLPSNAPSSYRVDIDDLLEKAEEFYDLEINQLGFVDPVNSNIAKYKVMILLNHTTEWVCYGSGYDFQVPALWLSPNTCWPVGQSVAHEVGHSFHYMCYSEASNHGADASIQTGFHSAIGNGSVTWEQTAQWQSLQSFPELMYSQSMGVFMNSHNYAFTHEWHRYQSYWFMYYLCEYYNDIKTIANVWNQHETSPVDFNQALMDLKGLSSDDLYKMYFDYACKLATWDLEACKDYRDSYIGSFNYKCSSIGDKEYQVALASCPQSTGFNIIPLNVPEAGTVVSTDFTALRARSALVDADPAQYLDGNTAWADWEYAFYPPNSYASYRGFRLGYVALLSDGTRQYFTDDEVHCTGATEKTESISFTVPENTERMWLVVSPAPSRYIQHLWDENFEKNDDLWPYKVKFNGTDIGSNATVYVQPTIDGREISDITFEYNVYFPANSSSYMGYSHTMDGRESAALGTAFQLLPGELNDYMENYSISGPSTGKIIFCACDPNGNIINSSSTANGYGHWFNANGNVVSYGSNSVIYSEFYPDRLMFYIGQYPGKVANGRSYTIWQALKYKKSDTEEAVAKFKFNVFIDANKNTTELVSITTEEGDPSGIASLKTNGDGKVDVYSLSGVKMKSDVGVSDVKSGLPAGIYIVEGKKMAIE